MARACRLGTTRLVNPMYIPRNQRVKEALAAATDHADLGLFEQLLEVLTWPFEERAGLEYYVTQRGYRRHL